MTKSRIDQVTRHRFLTTPNAEAMRLLLPDLGEALHNAAINLSRDYSLERIDAMLARLKGAESSLMHLRRAKAQERDA